MHPAWHGFRFYSFETAIEQKGARKIKKIR
jgi:hypothetical protein